MNLLDFNKSTGFSTRLEYNKFTEEVHLICNAFTTTYSLIWKYNNVTYCTLLTLLLHEKHLCQTQEIYGYVHLRKSSSSAHNQSGNAIKWVGCLKLAILGRRTKDFPICVCFVELMNQSLPQQSTILVCIKETCGHRFEDPIISCIFETKAKQTIMSSRIDVHI